MRYFAIFVLLLFVGCVDDATKMPTTTLVGDASRLEVVDHKKADTWHWKIIRDNKTEKEWFIIHDGRRIIVLPLDGSTPISVGD